MLRDFINSIEINTNLPKTYIKLPKDVHVKSASDLQNGNYFYIMHS